MQQNHQQALQSVHIWYLLWSSISEDGMPLFPTAERHQVTLKMLGLGPQNLLTTCIWAIHRATRLNSTMPFTHRYTHNRQDDAGNYKPHMMEDGRGYEPVPACIGREVKVCLGHTWPLTDCCKRCCLCVMRLEMQRDSKTDLYVLSSPNALSCLM